MSFSVVPDIVASVASDMDKIGSTISNSNATAVGPTTGVVPAAADDVSAAIAELFGQHAQDYRTVSTRMEHFHQQFVKAVTSSAAAYSNAESDNAMPLQSLLSGGALGSALAGELGRGGPPMGFSMPNLNSVLGGLPSPRLAPVANLLPLPPMASAAGLPPIQTALGAATAPLQPLLTGSPIGVNALPMSAATSGASRMLLDNAAIGAAGEFGPPAQNSGLGSTAGLLLSNAGAGVTGSKALLFSGGASRADTGLLSLVGGVDGGQGGAGGTGGVIFGGGSLFESRGAN